MNERAFFDFDGTLIKHDSFFKFAFFSLGKWRVYVALTKSLPIIAAWKLGVRTNSEAKEFLFSCLFKNYPHSLFKKKCEDFSSLIESMVREDVIAILKIHQKNGVPVSIVSASISDWIKPWATKNGIDNIIATEAEVDSSTGLLTGRFLTPNCIGPQKVERIKTAFPNINFLESWAYGDSSSDIPMLNLVGNPKKV